MNKKFNSEKYNVAICPPYEGKGNLLKNPHGFNICTRCGGFGLIKKEKEVSEEDRK